MSNSLTPELQAAHLANGQLVAENAQLRERVKRAGQYRREMQEQISELQARVRELEGGTFIEELAKLNKSIETAKQTLESQRQKVEQNREWLTKICNLASDFNRAVTDVLEDMS